MIDKFFLKTYETLPQTWNMYVRKSMQLIRHINQQEEFLQTKSIEK